MKNRVFCLFLLSYVFGFFEQQAFAGASAKAHKEEYLDVREVAYNLEHSEAKGKASLDKKEVFKKKRLRKPRPQTNYYDLEKVLTWTMIVLSVLGLVGFGLGMGLSLGWLWGIALGIFGMQFLWIFLGFAVPDGEAHMVIIGLILGGLILFGIESIILGLVFSMTWVWIMGLAILVLMVLAFLLFIAVISAAAPRHG